MLLVTYEHERISFLDYIEKQNRFVHFGTLCLRKQSVRIHLAK